MLCYNNKNNFNYKLIQMFYRVCPTTFIINDATRIQIFLFLFLRVIKINILILIIFFFNTILIFVLFDILFRSFLILKYFQNL